MNKPLVSICSTTYNRENYIGQALESWLAQKVNFEYEIVISDDCSTDNTVAVIEEYIKSNPTITIRLLKAEKNLGFVPNSVKVYENAVGKYIAHCDGDDYWIDEHKLQKQVDFLEQHPDYVMCFTNSYIQNDLLKTRKATKVNIWDSCDTLDILTNHNSLVAEKVGEIPTLGHMSSIVYRNGLISAFPKWYYTTYMNDDTLFVMLSKYGKAKLINDFCSIYRDNSEGVSKKNFSFEKDFKGRIQFYKDLNHYLDFKCNTTIKKLLALYYLKLFKLYLREKKYCRSISAFCEMMYHDSGLIIKKLQSK